MRYDKLVRDKIPDIIREKGGVPITHVATREEYLTKLEAKLSEEVGEFLESKDPVELADIVEVVLALGNARGLTREELEALRAGKAEKRGAFRKMIVLEEA